MVGVCDSRTGANILRFVPGGQVGGASFSPDGAHLLATVNRNEGSLHAIQIYALDVDELVSIALRTVTRGFTEAECRAYLRVGRCPDPEIG